MYNLLVSSDDEAWDGEPYFLDIGRCVREYTDAEISAKYGDFTQPSVKEIRRFPCILAYEARCYKDPHFGLIRDIAKRQGKVRIEYEIVPLDKFLSHSDISDMLFDLDIEAWEMNRTHWAIKNINLAKELASRGIHLPRWARSEAKAVDITEHEFDVALSFPGEIRGYIESIAMELERLVGPDSYFYDNNYIAQLAVASLDTLLHDIYGKRSMLVVVFLCKEYQDKEWCGLEFRVVKALIMEKQHRRVMFVRMDDCDVDGVFKTDGYIDGRKYSPDDIASFIEERISLLQPEP